MIFIFSGNNQQADYIANEKGLSRQDYRYLSRLEQLKGVRDAKVLTYGTYYERRDYDDIVNELEMLLSFNRITIEGGYL